MAECVECGKSMGFADKVNAKSYDGKCVSCTKALRDNHGKSKSTNAEKLQQEPVPQKSEPDVSDKTPDPQSEWISIATLPKTDFADAMLTLFKEVEQNSNVQQLVAYSTVKLMFRVSQRIYGMPLSF